MSQHQPDLAYSLYPRLFACSVSTRYDMAASILNSKSISTIIETPLINSNLLHISSMSTPLKYSLANLANTIGGRRHSLDSF